MFELENNQLIFKSLNNDYIELSPNNDINIDKLNDTLTFLLTQFITVKYYYDLFELVINVRLFFKGLGCKVYFTFRDIDKNEINLIGFLEDYNFFKVESSLFTVERYFSRPRELQLNLVLNSCKI